MKTSIASKRDIGTGRKILAVLLSCILITSLLPVPAFAGSTAIGTQATDISSATLSTIYEQTWAGSAMTPEPTVTYSGTPLVKDTDYTLSYTNNVGLGTATVTVTGIGSFSGTKSEDFIITPFAYHVVTDGSDDYGNGAYIDNSVVSFTNLVIPQTLGGATVLAANFLSGGLTSLDVSSATGLKRIVCSNSSLTSLNVNNNIDLQYLYCDFNSITSLDVSHNPQLVILQANNNVLTSLDVSENVALTKLSCSYNNLTSLDVSENIALQRLYCSYNNLTSLDVSANPQLWYLSCSDNRIADTSALVAWFALGHAGQLLPQNTPDLSLATLSPIYEQTWTGSALTPEPVVTYGGNTLVKDTDYTLSYTNNVDLGTATVTVTGIGIYGGTKSENFTITPFVYYNGSGSYGNGVYITDIVGGITAAVVPVTLGGASVVSIKLQNRGLTTLDTSSVTGLKNLNCSQNSLTSLDVSANTQLTFFDCNYNSLTSLDMSANTQLISFHCRNNFLTSLDVSTNTNLSLLDCQSNFLTSLDVSTNENLFVLDCRDNYIANTSALEAWLATGEHDGQVLPQNKIDISAAALSPIYEQTWTGSVLTPLPTVTLGGNTLVKDTDYTLSYTNNVDLGTATVTVTGIGGYTGTKSENFTITPFTYFMLTEGSSIYGNGAYITGIVSGMTDVVVPATLGGANVASLELQSCGLTTLDISSVTGLKYLDCNQNFLASLDVSTNTQLMFFACRYNSLTSLDLSANTQLGFFACSYNSLSSLDVSANTQLEFFLCDHNSLTSLDVSTNTNLSLLDCGNNYIADTSVLEAWLAISGHSGQVLPQNQFDISTATLSTIYEQTWTGSAITPEPTVTYGGNTLVKDTDYTLSYTNNVDLGTATVTVTGIGSYTGSASENFAIVSADISSATIEALSSETWTGSPITPIPVLTFNGITLTEGVDYTLTYADNTNVGTATVDITGIANFTGSTSATFDITSIDIASATVDSIADQIYTGDVITPLIHITEGSTTLTEGVDYTLTYADNTNVGTATVDITGIGGYANTTSVTFSIVSADISSATVDAISNETWTGSPITPIPVLTFNGITLTEGVDYTLTYADNTNVGTATVDITGIANFTGSASTTFDITSIDIASATVDSIADQIYTGDVITPLIHITEGSTTLTEGVDYTLTYADNTNVGTATVDITGIGGYANTTSVTFSIVSADISSATVDAISNETWTGSPITPIPVLTFNGITLTEGVDYTLTYADNTNVGTATVDITGIANFTGSASTTFDITSIDIASATVDSIADQIYTGDVITPLIHITEGSTTLTEGVDYTLTYADNTNVGTATVDITGIGGYANTTSVTFSIVSADISSATVDAISNETWTGSPITPIPVLTFNGITLTEGVDYTLTYADNTNVGTATVDITGIANFTGSTSATFDITSIDIASATVDSIADQIYTGDALVPVVLITEGLTTLVEGVDYTLVYSDNVSVGTATITITGIGGYANTTSATFNITPKSIALAVISPILDKLLYVGVPVEPALTVIDGEATLILGIDYTTNYINNTLNGTATATITGIGNYTATSSTDFTVVRCSDTDDDAWYITDGWLTYVVENDLMSGYADTTEFGPLDFISRGQAAAILYRAACNEDPSLIAIYGSTTDPSNYATTAVFDDEATGVYYTAAINWAKAAGVMSGYATEYKYVTPDGLITREELCTMIARYVRAMDPAKGANAGSIDYHDIQGMDEVSDWALANVEWCASWGVVGGVYMGGDVFVMNSHDATWRASMAKMITVSIRDIIG